MKKLLFIIAPLACILALASCKKNTDDTVTTTPTQQANPNGTGTGTGTGNGNGSGTGTGTGSGTGSGTGTGTGTGSGTGSGTGTGTGTGSGTGTTTPPTDLLPPSVLLASPKSNTILSKGSVVSLKGTVSDDVALKSAVLHVARQNTATNLIDQQLVVVQGVKTVSFDVPWTTPKSIVSTAGKDVYVIYITAEDMTGKKYSSVYSVYVQ